MPRRHRLVRGRERSDHERCPCSSTRRNRKLHPSLAARQGGENRNRCVVQAVLTDAEIGNTCMRRRSGRKPEAGASPRKTRGDRRREWNDNGARILDGDCSRGLARHFDGRTALEEADHPTYVADVHAVQTFRRVDAYRLSAGEPDLSVVAPVGSLRRGRHITHGTHQALVQGDDALVAVATTDQYAGDGRPNAQYDKRSCETEPTPHSLKTMPRSAPKQSSHVGDPGKSWAKVR